LKKLAIALLVLVVVLIGAVLAAPLYLDVNQYKGEIEETASEMLGRKVVIDGTISVSLFPTTSLSVENVKVDNINGGKASHFLTLKSLDIKTGFFPLLRGDIEAEKITLVSPVIHLEKLKGGRVNWEFKTPKTSADETSHSSEISVDEFELAGGVVSYKDLSKNDPQSISGINAIISMKSLQGPFKVEGSAKYQKLPVKITLSIGKIIKGKNTAVDLVSELFQGKVTAEYRGIFNQLKKQDKTSGRIKIKANSLKDLQRISDVLGNVSQNKSSENPAFNQALSAEMNITASEKEIDVSDMVFRLGKSNGKAQLHILLSEDIHQIKANVQVNNFDLDPFVNLQDVKSEKLKQPEQIDYEKLFKKWEGSFNLKLDNVAYNGGMANKIILSTRLKNGAVHLTQGSAMMPGGSKIHMTGIFNSAAAKDNLLLNIDLKSGRLRKLLTWFNMDVSSVPFDRLNSFKINADINLTDDLIVVSNLKGGLDSLVFSGGVKIETKEGNPPFTNVKLHLSNVNFDHYSAPSDEKADLKKSLTALAALKIKYDLTFKSVTVQKILMKLVILKGDLLDDHLNLAELKIVDFAGFDISASAKGKGFALNPNLNFEFSAHTKDLRKLQRAFKFKSDVNLKQIGSFSVKGNGAATFEKLIITAQSKVSSLAADLEAVVQAPTLKQLPEIGSTDVKISGKGASYLALLKQFGLKTARPVTGYDAPVSFKVALNGNKKIINIQEGTFDIAGGKMTVKGRLSKIDDMENMSSDLNITAASPDFKKFIYGVGLEMKDAKSSLGAFTLKAKFFGTKKQMNIPNVAAQVGSAKFSGSGKILTKENEVPFLDFKITAGDLIANDFINTKNSKEAGKGGNWDKTVFPTDNLRLFNGRFNVTAGRFEYKNYLFENPSFELTLQDGLMSVNNFTGRVFGGQVAATAFYDASVGTAQNPVLNLDFNLSKASWQKISSVVTVLKPISGNIDVKGKFTAYGNSQYSLVKSFTGQGRVNTDDAQMVGVDLPAIGSGFKNLNNLGELASLLGKNLGGGVTNFKALNIGLTLKDGKAVLKPFKLQMQKAAADMNISLDLFNWRYNVSGAIKLDDLAKMPLIGLRITGGMNAPKVKFDTESLAKYAAVEFAKKNLDSLLGADDGLGGVFKDLLTPKPKPKPPVKQ
jgi:uncharacterized protein involved in outer membrane biogenesis